MPQRLLRRSEGKVRIGGSESNREIAENSQHDAEAVEDFDPEDLVTSTYLRMVREGSQLSLRVELSKNGRAKLAARNRGQYQGHRYNLSDDAPVPAREHEKKTVRLRSTSPRDEDSSLDEKDSFEASPIRFPEISIFSWPSSDLSLTSHQRFSTLVRGTREE
jgi:hypothetical protein